MQGLICAKKNLVLKINMQGRTPDLCNIPLVLKTNMQGRTPHLRIKPPVLVSNLLHLNSCYIKIAPSH